MTRVIKLGGRAQSHCAPSVAQAWSAEPGALCLVHGGGDEVSALQKRLGTTPEFVGGRRVTSGEDIALLRMVLSGLVNKRLVSQLVSAGVPAVGLSGEDAGLLTAAVSDSGKLGRVGHPTRVDKRVLTALMSAGMLPVISPLAADEAGGALNVNGDDAAAAIAAAIAADELVLVVDVEGVLAEDGSLLTSLDSETARALVGRGTATGGMSAKLEAAQAALVGGVPLVRICSLAGVTDPARGSHITLTPSLV